MSEQPEVVMVPADAIKLRPKNVQFVYRQEDGGDIVGMLIEDIRRGPFFMSFTEEEARYVAMNLWAFASDLPNQRAQWEQMTEGDESNG